MSEKIQILMDITGMVKPKDAPGNIQNAVIMELAETVRGSVVRPGDEGYEQARAVWNGQVDCRPEVIIRAADASDVIAAVNLARETGALLAVRGAGHHPCGFGTVEGSIVLDMGGMKGIDVDAEARMARVAAGATAGEFMHAIHEKGFISTVGSHPTVGIAGMTLGGGMGLLMGKYGLACDNLISAQIVTADGILRTVSDTENPDLFWAIRGGGGNFGVVTELTFRVHPVEPVLGGFIIHPMERAVEATRFFREFAANAPEELGLAMAMLTTPDGNSVCAYLVCWSGDPEEGAKVLAPLRAFGPPIVDMVQPMPYTFLLDFFKDHDPAGAQYSYSMRGLPEISDDLIETVARFAAAKTSPETVIVLYHMGGAARRVPIEATAYSHRQVPHFIGIYAGWNEGDPMLHEAWCREFRAAVEPHTTGTSYLNLMNEVGESEVRASYGANFARLQAVKAAYDPQNLFRRNANIPPAEKA